MSDELLPCPFCGGADIRISGDAFDRGGMCVQCMKCDAAMGEKYDRDAMPDHAYGSEADAIAAWNRRAAPPVPASRVPLSEEQVLTAIQSCGTALHGRIALTYESGPYDIDKSTVVAMQLVRAIEAAHGITALAGDGGTGLTCHDSNACAAGQRPCPTPAACRCAA